MGEKFENSKANGPHAQLSKLVGNWEGIAKTWFEPDKTADESPAQGSMRLILGGQYIMHEYKGSFGGKPLEGVAIIGYHLDLRKFQCAWVDSFHTGSAIIFSEGNKDDASINVLGSYAYVTPELEQYWGWRTEIELINENEIRMTAYNVSPDGDEARATEIIYKKVS